MFADTSGVPVPQLLIVAVAVLGLVLTPLLVPRGRALAVTAFALLLVSGIATAVFTHPHLYVAISNTVPAARLSTPASSACGPR